MKTALLVIVLSVLSVALFSSARSIRRKVNGTVVPETQDLAAEQSEQEVETEPEVQEVETEPEVKEVETEPEVQEVETEPKVQEVDVEPEIAAGDQVECLFILSRLFS